MFFEDVQSLVPLLRGTAQERSMIASGTRKVGTK